MFTMPFRKREREQGAFLNETQRTLINEKFEILQQASFGFSSRPTPTHFSRRIEGLDERVY